MLLASFFRLLRFLITSVACSLPIYLANYTVITDNGILLLSFIAFVLLTCIDAYRFSFDYWERVDYYLGILLPLLIYIIISFLFWLVFPPAVFNRIFLPLRFALCFGMKTIESIVIVGIAFIVIVTVLRFFGARAGRLFSNNFAEKEEDM